MPAPRVALKIDVDTFRGTRDGVPAMLADLAAAGVRASFFFSLGPDRSGRAVFRLLTHPRFAAKMVRTNAARMYGLETALYGTLLPSPIIGRRCREVLLRCRAAGHEVGLHAWDHRTWQDRLDRLARPAVERLIDRGIAAFAELFGERPRGFAAPAWFCTDDAFEALAARGFDYLSVSRGAAPPFHPWVRGRPLAALEIPTTLPTFDEELGRGGVDESNYVERLVARYRGSPASSAGAEKADGAEIAAGAAAPAKCAAPAPVEVLTLHAESEGLAFRHLFRRLLARHAELGVATLTLGELAAEARRAAAPPPVRRVLVGEVPGRASRVVIPGEPVRAAG
jgi:undecaprenyl phosphate-alpha-L-ara4FN deformylase